MERSNIQDQEGDGRDIIKPSLSDLAFDNETRLRIGFSERFWFMCYEISDVAGCDAVSLGE